MILWKELEFEKAFFDMTAKAHKVDQGMFLKSGGFPIIDQGQKFIAGYSNDAMLVWKRQLPVLIFGDHTRIVKYINFPFILGADGTKVLEINKELFPMFAYYQLLSHEIPSAGYSRHFKFLKEWVVRFPPYAEQQRIADILEKADGLRRLRRYARQLSDGYLQSIFLEMFGDPKTNPKKWEVDAIEKAILSTQNGFSPREDFSSTGNIVLRIRDISTGKIDYSKPRRMILTDRDLAKYALDQNDLIIVRVNGNPNLVGIASEFVARDEQIVFSDHVIRVRLDAGLLNTTFVVHLLNSPYGRKETVNNISTTAGQYTINSPGFSRIKTIYPPLSEQERFSKVVKEFNRFLFRQTESERQTEQLFQSLLRRAFEGEL